MINLPVSEAEAFDYLAILAVKITRGLQNGERYNEVLSALDNHTHALARLVRISAEYEELVAANLATFDAIERAYRDEISASEVQRLNHRRYLAKRALQARFWPGQPLSERKTDLPSRPPAPTVPASGAA